ncbi:hypothetical protein AHF37_08283 [Paragonimus kellicotti]|nr:hypothetical protein AHF37_08283 [Paragonimus kellicotti]
MLLEPLLWKNAVLPVSPHRPKVGVQVVRAFRVKTTGWFEYQTDRPNEENLLTKRYIISNTYFVHCKELHRVKTASQLGASMTCPSSALDK